MPYKKHDFPFCIMDVVELLGIQIKKTTSVCLYTVCPFCDDTSGHLRIDLLRDYYNCPRCNTGGGMLNLYSRLTNTTLKEANIALRQRLSTTFSGTVKRNAVKSKQINVAERSVDEVRQVYGKLIDMLPLSRKHYRSLLARGFTEEDIRRIKFRSITKRKGRCEYSERLIQTGFDLEGIPGFYLDPNLDKWVMYSPYDGIIYPQKNRNLKNTFLSIRRDYASKNKYVWFSSAGKLEHKGSSLSSIRDYPGLLHYVGDFNGGILIITEGQIKAEVIYSIFRRLYPKLKISILGQSGVCAQSVLPAALDKLSGKGFYLIVEAYDRNKFTKDVALAFEWKDFKENLNVIKAAGTLETLVMECTKSWNIVPRFMHLPPSRYLEHGYDDSLLFVHNKVQRNGELGVGGIKPSYWPYALSRK